MNCAVCPNVDKASILGSVGFCMKYFKEVRLDPWVKCVEDTTKHIENKNIVIEQETAQAKERIDMPKRNFIKNLTPEQRQWIYENYSPALSKAAVAKHLGVCLQTIHNNDAALRQMSKHSFEQPAIPQENPDKKKRIDEIKRVRIKTGDRVKEFVEVKQEKKQIPAGWEEYRRQTARELYLVAFAKFPEMESKELASKIVNRVDDLILQLI